MLQAPKQCAAAVAVSSGHMLTEDPTYHCNGFGSNAKMLLIPQVEGTTTMHQARMVHQHQMEGMQEHKLTAAIILAITMVLPGFELVFEVQHVSL